MRRSTARGVPWDKAPDFDERDLAAAFPRLRDRKGFRQVLVNLQDLFLGTAPAQAADLLVLHGAGVNLRTGTPRPGAVRGAYREVVTDPAYRETAARLGAELRSLAARGPRRTWRSACRSPGSDHAARSTPSRRTTSSRIASRPAPRYLRGSTTAGFASR